MNQAEFIDFIMSVKKKGGESKMKTIDRIRGYLRDTGEEMLKLSDRLEAGQVPLNKQERELVRMASVNLLKAAFDEGVYFFFSNNHESFMKAMEDIVDVAVDVNGE